MSRKGQATIWLLLIALLVATNPSMDEYASYVMRREEIPLLLQGLGKPVVAATTERYDCWMFSVYVDVGGTTVGLLSGFIPVRSAYSVVKEGAK